MKHLYSFIFFVFAISCQAAFAAENEPNNIAAQATVLTLNGSDSGRIHPAGDVDWWKVTTTADGKLDISLSNASGKSMSVYLYDNNSTSVLVSGTSKNNLVRSRDGLAAGTYYIKIICDSTSDTANYKISNTLVVPAQANDIEPNGSKALAQPLTLNSSTTGHVGYYYKNKRDTADWYKITTDKDGRIDLSLYPAAGTDTWVYLYDNNGTTLLSSKHANVNSTLSTDGLAPGTYFIKINCNDKSRFTPYVLTNNLAIASQVNDVEPNNTRNLAIGLTLNVAKTGHIGYYYNNKRDTTDWYKVTTNKEGSLSINLTPYNGSAISAYLYDNDGVTLLEDSNNVYRLLKDGLGAGTYFIKIKTSDASKFTPYSIKATLDTVAQANDAEPNNASAEAAPLALNKTQTGHVGFYYNNKRDTADWYKLTTDQDGRIDLTLTPVKGVNTWIYLYDNNGKTLLNSKDSGYAFTMSTDGLASGTYYVKISCADNSMFTGYTLTNNLVTLSQAKDVEPNNTKAQALTLNLNSKKTGHVGYYYNNKRDTADWYKITTKVDTKLKLKLNLTNGQPLSVSLYAGNGTSLINSFTSGASFNLVTDGLEDDVYYIKINSKSPAGFAPYTLTDSIFAPPTTDTLILPLNYRITDTIQKAGDVDWFKVTTNADGALKFTVTPLSTKFIWLYLYDKNGTSLLESAYSNAAFNISKDGLAAGTYYVRINAYYSTDTLKYLLADTLQLPLQKNDVEPNNSPAEATTLKLNSTTSGNVGYYYNNRRDTADWYKVTTNADGLLKLRLTPANGSFIWAYLYDNDGVTQLAADNSNAGFNLLKDGLAAGTYYVRINCYYNSHFTPYTLTDSLIKPAQANDIEPNNKRSQAITLKLNSGTTGHVGYYYDNKRDTADWYKITTNAEGLLRLNLTPANGSFLWAYLYDNDGVTQLAADYSNGAFSVSRDGLAAGTYYVRVNCYYNNHFTPYTLADSLFKPAVANDVEPNNTRAQALALDVNSTVPGHVGYYYNTKRDTADWYKITTTKNGMLRLRLTPSNGSYLWVYLYDNDGVSQLAAEYSNGAFIVNKDGLAAGTYYLRVNCYYNYQFTPYTLTDSLFTYAFANDIEPNNKAVLAKNVAPNSKVTGNVNFYYNLVKDNVDWWKLNYTGSGNLQFLFNLAPKKIDGVIPYTWFYVYKDTLAAPVYASYFNTASNVIDLSSLAKATYYIAVVTYYQSDFVTYSFSNSFVAPAPVIAGAAGRGVINDANINPYNISIYPNPVSSRFHIQMAGAQANLASAILLDANGKQVWGQYNRKLLSGAGLEVNVSKFPAGTYMLQMIDEKGVITTKKILIVK